MAGRAVLSQSLALSSVSPNVNDMERGESVQGGAEGNQQGGSEEKEKDEEGEDQEEEVAEPRIAPVPIRPSTSEVDSHMLTHLPYRAWCPHCIRGKSKGRPHNRANVSAHVMPTVAIDYMFMTESQNMGDESGMPILVARDLHHDECGTGMSLACVVPNKGVNPYVVKLLSNFIALLGHGQFEF